MLLLSSISPMSGPAWHRTFKVNIGQLYKSKISTTTVFSRLKIALSNSIIDINLCIQISLLRMWRPTGNAAHTVRIRIVVKTKMLENLTFYFTVNYGVSRWWRTRRWQYWPDRLSFFMHFSPSKFLSKRLTCIQNLTRSGCSSYSSCPGYNDQ